MLILNCIALRCVVSMQKFCADKMYCFGFFSMEKTIERYLQYAKDVHVNNAETEQYMQVNLNVCSYERLNDIFEKTSLGFRLNEL